METVKYFSKEDFISMGIAIAHAYRLLDKFVNNDGKT